MLTFNVADMTCGRCESRIKAAIGTVDSDAKVEVLKAEKKVSIQSTLDAELFAEAIREAGYTPLPA
ncbi:heavy-metal-associated domain-containing protein [Glaciimonas soli]|uniref:Copper chaperone n=1 Tax=Glaciimonas soli TaxID=2590999 RepID=A0A843YPN2_9BURK|nr:heavy-metal-associated domain-containing protein [Glaciimonas soli]MQQ99936.1 copper chaperone [Glaciimonas soli]